MFKLGRFAEAEAAYSSAISQLPDSHLLLVPLLNNRTLSRMRTGNVSGAIEDCTTVITIIGPSYHPAREAKVTREEDGGGVDLGDALVKAWRRRAEAYEGKEKWDLARQDWESIAGADFAGRQRSEASSGIGRCRRMLTADDTASTGVAPSAPPRRAPRPPPRRGPTPPSEALARLKQANQEAEAEEQARLELKDSVDSRLGAWKNGKETNLRALVASLDTVLWPELGWQKVGMAELVTPNQVKIRYTKAIAKLHPDKVRSFDSPPPLYEPECCASTSLFFFFSIAQR
jgi:tetratricopeptide (TPR) repeat protein